jgi:uncharacterized membrane protein YdbT with pleckstrin-like domain
MPKQLLSNENRVLPPIHRHWIWPTRKVAPVALLLLVLIVIVDSAGSIVLPAVARLLVTLVLLAAIVAWGIVAWAQWAANTLTVTDQRVILEVGILLRRSKVVPLDRIQDIQTTQTLMGRLLDYGTIEINVAATQGTETFPYLRSPELLRDQVYVLSEHARK